MNEQLAGPPSPDATLVSLDESQLRALREVGHQWSQVCADPHVWRRALPVDPNLGSFPDPKEVRPTRFGRFVQVQSAPTPEVEATPQAEVAASLPALRVGHELRRALLGPPLRSTAIARERMRKLVALPVLSADAL